MIDFKNIITSTTHGVQNRIGEVLSTFPDLHMEYQIDWSDNICSRSQFKQFAVDKLSKSMAYGADVLSKIEAENILEHFIANFEEDCQFYTNWDDIEYSQDKSLGWTPITKSTFDCCLIFIDNKKVGVIIITDED